MQQTLIVAVCLLFSNGTVVYCQQTTPSGVATSSYTPPMPSANMPSQQPDAGVTQAAMLPPVTIAELAQQIAAVRQQSRAEWDLNRQLMESNDRVYIQRFDADASFNRAERESTKELVEHEFSAAKEAVAKADLSNEKRFDAQNEFRAQLTDQAGRFITKDTVDAKISTVYDKIANVETILARQGGPGDPNTIAMTALAGRIDRLESFVATTGGKGEGISMIGVLLVGGFGIAGVIVAIMTSVMTMVQRRTLAQVQVKS